MILTSPLLPVPHGFPMRDGGVSTGAYASLNCALSTEDDPAAVAENHRILTAKTGVLGANFRTAIQVHGVNVIEATGLSPSGNDVPKASIDADAVWTETPGLAVGVRTADCIPVLLADVRQKRVAAIHAGWRGVIGEITARTIDIFIKRGSAPADLRAVVGPCIQRCCFEVDGDLPARFSSAFGPDVVVSPRGKPAPAFPPSAPPFIPSAPPFIPSGVEGPKHHIDLSLAVKQTLLARGISPAHLEVMPECTHCDTRFFSHRRDHGVTGRHLSFISHVF